MRARLAIVALLVSGCGYSTGLSIQERYPSVGIELFGNESYERDLERPLHDELSRSLRDLTDTEIRAPSDSEYVIRGVIKTYHRRGGIRSPKEVIVDGTVVTRENELLETGVTIGIEATLFQRGVARPLGPPAKVEGEVGYILKPTENERIARDRLLRYLADEIVLELFSPAGTR